MKNDRFLWFLYALTVAFFLIGNFFPQSRLWAFSQFSYLSLDINLSLLIIALFVPVILHLLPMKIEVLPGDGRVSSRGILIAFISAIIFGTIFYLFRVKTHLLGDGYALLSMLGTEEPLIKTREIGESLAHLWLAKSLRGMAENPPLMSYQIISVFSGFIATFLTILFSYRLFRENWSRLLFSLSILTGGYGLLFFGYVENYSLFVMVVLIYSLTVLTYKQNKKNVTLLIGLNSIAIFLHIFGVAFIPSTLYLLLRDSSIGQKVSKAAFSTKLIIVSGAILLGLGVAVSYYKYSIFFKYSILLPFPDQFTVNGYTMLSSAHLLDIANLLFMLAPGLMIIIFVFIGVRHEKIIRSPNLKATAIFFFSGFAFILLFDPKLGMPRDWDLFSFIAIPLLVGFSYLVLRSSSSVIRGHKILVVTIVLGLLLLVARVHNSRSVSAAIDQTFDNFSLDPQKSRHSVGILEKFCLEQGRTKMADSAIRFYINSYPEAKLNDEGKLHLKRGEYSKALLKFNEVLKIDPSFIYGYFNQGLAHMGMQKYKEAISRFEIVEGLNPYDGKFPADIGYCYFLAKNYDKAEVYALRALQMSDTIQTALMTMVNIKKLEGDRNGYLDYLKKSVSFDSSPPPMLREMAVYLASIGKSKESAIFLNRLLSGGMDIKNLESFFVSYPDVKQFMNK